MCFFVCLCFFSISHQLLLRSYRQDTRLILTQDPASGTQCFWMGPASIFTVGSRDASLTANTKIDTRHNWWLTSLTYKLLMHIHNYNVLCLFINNVMPVFYCLWFIQINTWEKNDRRCELNVDRYHGNISKNINSQQNIPLNEWLRVAYRWNRKSIDKYEKMNHHKLISTFGTG